MSAPPLVADLRGPGLFVAPGIEIPATTEIHPHVTIYAGVVLGDGVLLDQGAILGRPQRIDPRSRSPRRTPDAPTTVGDGCRIGNTTVLTAGSHVGHRTYVGDVVLLRETVVLGEDVVVGRLTGIAHSCRVGDRTRIHNNGLIGPWTTLEEDVLVSPSVTFVGDQTMGRRPRDGRGGITVRRAARIGSSVIIMPGVEIGEEAVVGAGALVRQDVPPRTVVAGSPARVLREVRDDELLEGWN
ncbi:MAG: N-acetyltransferase [Solirubrobacterales bacterium]|nr:N-acetyltransferase [Solirubrobacterales bacterium]